MFVTAFLFEAGLGLVAVVAGAVVGIAPLATLHGGGPAILAGILGTLPMFLFFSLCLSLPWPSMQRIREVLEQALGGALSECTTLQLAGLSLAAGFGEELLFRGFIQGGFAAFLPPWAALAAASLVFGLAHPLTRGYIVLAAVMGAYLGWMWTATADLAAPLIAHALYDFIALVVLVRRLPRSTVEAEAETSAAEDNVILEDQSL